MTEKEIFDRAVNIELEILAAKENLSELKDEAKEVGIKGKQFTLIVQCAKTHVANTFEEKVAGATEFTEKYKELTGYDN